MYNFLFGPVLVGRFIIFVIIPIISLITFLTYRIENNKLKYFLIFIITIPTTINHVLYENSFKQFYGDVYATKPQIRNALKFINYSDTKTFTLLDNKAKEKNSFLAYQNYVLIYKKKLKYNLNYFQLNEEETLPKNIWVIHIRDVYKDFYIPKSFENYKITDKKQFNNLDLVKLTK